MDRGGLFATHRTWRRALGLAGGLALALGSTACPPVMPERDGHRIFNPAYLPFLESSSRDEWQLPDRVIETLSFPQDAVVADIGAGGGYFTERFSKRLEGTGHVFATDVQDEMIQALRERVRTRGLDNVTVVRASFDDPMLPDACCDLVFFSSVYKEIDGRIDYMGRVQRALRPGGRVAILEFRPEARGSGPPVDARLDPDQIVGELAAAGFVLVERHDFLPRQSFLIFLREEGLAEGSHRTSAIRSLAIPLLLRKS
ncbi:MAG: class I SAM-dependent methyltransferase [Deltaproteobacteria bacterium]|nr:class I SAM-dependent methyltransferase [Deltaproteobacteria bacterium]